MSAGSLKSYQPIPDEDANRFLQFLRQRINQFGRVKVKCSFLNDAGDLVEAEGWVSFNDQGGFKWEGVGRNTERLPQWPVVDICYTGAMAHINNVWQSIEELTQQGVQAISQTSAMVFQAMEERNNAHYQQYNKAQEEIANSRLRAAEEAAAQQHALEVERQKLAAEKAFERAEIERMRQEFEAYKANAEDMLKHQENCVKELEKVVKDNQSQVKFQEMMIRKNEQMLLTASESEKAAFKKKKEEILAALELEKRDNEEEREALEQARNNYEKTQEAIRKTKAEMNKKIFADAAKAAEQAIPEFAFQPREF